MHLPSLIAIAVAGSLALGGIAASAAPPPKVPVSLDALPRPLPYPYDEKADANAQVAAAKARAKRSGKTLLIDLGGNWCPDCRILAGVMALPTVKAFIDKHYEMVAVDIGRFDKNGQIPLHYGIADLKGVPALLVVNPGTDKLINAGRVSALSDARNMTPQALADWLAQWV